MNKKNTKGNILKIVILILPAIFFVLFTLFNSSENMKDIDNNTFDYYQP